MAMNSRKLPSTGLGAYSEDSALTLSQQAPTIARKKPASKVTVKKKAPTKTAASDTETVDETAADEAAGEE